MRYIYLKTCNASLYNPLSHSCSQPMKTKVLWSKHLFSFFLAICLFEEHFFILLSNSICYHESWLLWHVTGSNPGIRNYLLMYSLLHMPGQSEWRNSYNIVLLKKTCTIQRPCPSSDAGIWMLWCRHLNALMCYIVTETLCIVLKFNQTKLQIAANRCGTKTQGNVPSCFRKKNIRENAFL